MRMGSSDSRLVKVAIEYAERADEVGSPAIRGQRLRKIAATVATLGEDVDFMRYVQGRKADNLVVRMEEPWKVEELW